MDFDTLNKAHGELLENYKKIAAENVTLHEKNETLHEKC